VFGQLFALRKRMNIGVFFERNGILNLVKLHKNHQINPISIVDFTVNTEAIIPLRKLKKAGCILIGTTNQPGLSLGYQSRFELDQMHGLLIQNLGLNEIYTCPHDHTDECVCRKPKTGLFMEAAHKWRLDMDHSFVVSDKWQDAMAAHALGCTSILISSPWIGQGHHDFVLPTLTHAVDKIIHLQHSKITFGEYTPLVHHASEVQEES
jgi:histidinol-phosphate phosphatase family protein